MDNSNTVPLGSTAAKAQERTTSSRIKSIFSGSVGNMVEWYDWYVYAAFSLYFAKAFFPKGDTTAQLLNTAAIFAVGFLMRPIGGWLMGLYADKVGRKKALMASVYLMCFGSLLIALSPGYEIIGIGAPILLVFARLLQGLSVGGEYGTSATYLSEMATKERRGFYSSFQYVTLISGQLIALAVLILLQQVLTTEQLYAWGWRIPFAIGALCAVVALYLRRGMEETESFTFLIMAALIIVSGYTSINAVVKAELFPTEIRALGVGLPYALTVSIFGGTAEYIALWFKSIGMETGYYWYVTACIAVSLMVYVTMKDTRKHSRITTD